MTARDASAAVLLRQALVQLDHALPVPVPHQLQQLIDAGHDRLALPAGGQTLVRWQALAAVAQHDLSLAKLFESHTDARAILFELEAAELPLAKTENASWGVWAAEAPGCRVLCGPVAPQAGASVQLTGTKAWCSGAECGSHALLTAWGADGSGPHLIAVALDQPGVSRSAGNWHAVGMAGSASWQVQFADATGVAIGAPGQYLSRPGFWQGGAGVAACWYGGTLCIAQALRDALVHANPARRDCFRLAAAGEVDVVLQSTALLLRHTAQWIDAHPNADARTAALRVRLGTAACAQRVLALAGDVLGAAPFCRDRQFAQAAADLPVFIRQCHAGHDYAALGEQLLDQGIDPWAL